MIQRMSHTTLYVLDQDKAKEFYAGKLGFEVRTDATMPNGFRWLTVGPKGQPDFEIVLMKPAATGQMDEESAAALRKLLEKGLLGAGVFETADCRKTYEELVARGVHFSGPPEEQFYGVATVFRDDCGNWFSLTQPR